MKKQIKTITFALILGITAGTANNVLATKSGSLNENVSTSKEEFSEFMKQNAGSKVNFELVDKYNEIVDLYTNKSVSFYNLNDSQKAEFEKASASLMKTLSEINNPEANNWANKIKLNKSIFEFIWNSKNINNSDIANDIIVSIN